MGTQGEDSLGCGTHAAPGRRRDHVCDPPIGSRHRPNARSADPDAVDPIVAFFDRHARGYDAQLLLERRALRVASAFCEPIAEARVVDLAAGSGALSAAILDRGRTPGSLILVDGAARMLERARQRLGQAGIAAGYIVADVRAVPLEDGCADVVTMGYLLHLLDPDARRRVLNEALRLLAPRGRLVAVVHGCPPGRAGGIYRRGWWVLHRLVPGGLVGGGPLPDLAPLLAAAGFEVTSSRRVSGVYWSQVVAAVRPVD